MEGKTFFVLFGLVVVQVLAALYMALFAPFFTLIFELVIALTFMAALAHFLHSAVFRSFPETAFLVIAFAIGFLNVVYLSFNITSIWLVLMISLDSAGFILSLDQLRSKKSRSLVLSYPSSPSTSSSID